MKNFLAVTLVALMASCGAPAYADDVGGGGAGRSNTQERSGSNGDGGFWDYVSGNRSRSNRSYPGIDRALSEGYQADRRGADYRED